jgi:hypothetical protein
MGGDWQRNLLQFLDNNEKYRSTRGETEWQSFVETCKNQVSFDPDNDTVTEGITHLANQATPPWRTVWNRFSESHRNYPNIPAQIRKIPYTPNANANANSDSDNPGWPQWHENQENTLREELKKIEQLTLHDANNTLAKLNETHKKRCTGVWSQLGESPLAHAVATLAKMIDTIIDTPNTGDLHDIENAYSERGWEIDDAFIHTLTFLEKHPDISAVKSILTAFYLPWADNMARRLQDLVNKTGYPRPSYRHENPPQYNPGECILFIDGLRFDQAKKLSQRLTCEQYQVAEHMAWTPLPTVTATCKPALSPIGRHFKGPGTTSTFEPTGAADSQAIYTTQQFHNRLNQSDWEVITPDQPGDIKGNAWTEYGDTDKRGHNSGWKLAKELDHMLDEITARIKQLADAGWKKIHVITDHGWLLFPGGLPKSELPKILTATQWGRCALIKPGARCAEQLFPWYWNPDITIAMAQGVHCYKKGVEYTHGGLSFQECLTLQLIIIPSTPPESQIEIANITWKKLRCSVTITVTGNYPNPSVDIRTKANDPHTSIVLSIKTFNEDGFASVVVENESLEGKEAFLIISDEKRQVLNQVPVIIGGGTL